MTRMPEPGKGFVDVEEEDLHLVPDLEWQDPGQLNDTELPDIEEGDEENPELPEADDSFDEDTPEDTEGGA